ncbi:hypothetical protein DdX_12040 [Ditylenchus destructor]|uniref:Secreted protein n=1 Tax=Ditylenchus destructor TaxID=166010 RepID=A0AAD4N145_9BILA|nr:hypothetical protein DdX_12040 [Ditylenchus destructor]
MKGRGFIFILLAMFILQLVPLYVSPPPGTSTNDDPSTQGELHEDEAQKPEEGGSEEPKRCDSQETESEQKRESFSNPPMQHDELNI